MLRTASRPIDSASGSAAAYAAVKNKPFPKDIFTAPKLRWAVIGCGVIANQMAQVFELAGRHLAGVANRTPEKLVPSPSATMWSACMSRSTSSTPTRRSMPSTSPHRITPTSTSCAVPCGGQARAVREVHYAQQRRLDEARELARAHNVVLMDATTILHMPLYQEVRRRADAGEFGRLNLAQVNFGSYKEYGDLTNRFFNPKLAGGAMLDIGVYAISIARLFMRASPPR